MGYDSLDKTAEKTLRLEQQLESSKVAADTLLVHVNDPLAVAVTLPAKAWFDQLEFRILCEDGQQVDLAVDGCAAAETDIKIIDGIQHSSRMVHLDIELPVGYHKVELRQTGDETIATTTLIVTPVTCYQPEPLQSGQRIFGISVQLYTVRSGRNWGIGDFTDLRHFLVDAAGQGVDVVGLNPMHALFPANPLHFSPYSPSNRAFLNVMYIDPEELDDYATCSSARKLFADRDFQRQLTDLRTTSHVDYAGVANAKFRVLELLYQHFTDSELDSGSDRARDFESFVADQGLALLQHATYEALHEHFYVQDWHIWGWPVWPKQYQDPGTEEVRAFSQENITRVRYFMYLQWCAHRQLRAAQQAALDAGMAIGIYTDLAVGADIGGSEVWANQDKFCLHATAGAPPDKLAREGQNWGFPPLDPIILRESGYELFVLGVLALESHRNNCLVIGEDLGTVPKLLTEVMHQHHVYSYRVLYFENDNGGMNRPEDYPREAVASVTTHDLPTLASWWDESDLDLRAELGLLGDEATIEIYRTERNVEKNALLKAVADAGLWQGSLDMNNYPAITHELNVAIHAFLASSHSAVMVCQLEDLQQMLEPVNVPGTFDEYPNWQRKVLLPIENFFERKQVAEICDAITAQRSR
jgi:4-alpha-glucanotransferase